MNGIVIINKEINIMKKYDLEMQKENISKGYTRAEVLEMLMDLFDTIFYSDGDIYYMEECIEEKGHARDWVQNKAVRQFYEELKDKLDNEERIGLEEKE
jgi:6-phosphogluconate dehydrogenase (decarboxylating)